MALDAEIVNDLRNIATATEEVGKANETTQRKASSMGDSLARSVRKSRNEVDRSNKSWKTKKETIDRATQAVQKHTASQRAGRAVMGQVNQGVSQLRQGFAALAPAMLVP